LYIYIQVTNLHTPARGVMFCNYVAQPAEENRNNHSRRLDSFAPAQSHLITCEITLERYIMNVRQASERSIRLISAGRKNKIMQSAPTVAAACSLSLSHCVVFALQIILLLLHAFNLFALCLACAGRPLPHSHRVTCSDISLHPQRVLSHPLRSLARV
jgi:hypothetical protein